MADLERVRSMKTPGATAHTKTRRRAYQFTIGWLGAAAVVANREEDTLAMELMLACGIETLADLDGIYRLEQYDRDSLAAAIARST